MEINKRGPRGSNLEEFGNVEDPESYQDNVDKGIDSDFTAWGEKLDTMKNFEPVDLNIPAENTHLPNIKDDRAFEENPFFVEEPEERLPTDTLNERETGGK